MFSQFRREIVRKQTKLVSLLQHEIPKDDEEVYSEDVKEPNEYLQFDHALKMEDQSVDGDEIEIEEEEIEALEECMDEEFMSNGNIFTVQVLSEPDEVHQCETCSFQGVSAVALKSHIKKSHNIEESNETNEEETKQLFTCDICSQEFHKRHLLNRHIRQKHSEKERKYQCVFCEKLFFNNSNLKKHEESHNQKNLPCQFCGKLFSCTNNLRSHLYYHSEPKFKCNFDGCGKTFFMKKLLTAHLNVSLSLVNFKRCNNLIFYSSYQTHVGQKDFQCGFCDKKYFFHNHLKRHIRSSKLIRIVSMIKLIFIYISI